MQQTYKAVNRKFAASAKFWLHQLHHAQAQNDAAYVAAVMDRAIKSTPARKHVKVPDFPVAQAGPAPLLQGDC